MTDLFALGEKRLDWLAHRQATIARNVVNADTPGYKPRDVVAFDDQLDAKATSIAVTDPRHMTATGAAAGAPATRETRGWESSVSGGSVSLEQELSRAAEVNRQAGVASAAMKAFHRLTLLTAKG